MLSTPMKVFLALLRIAAGVSLLMAGTHKLSWFGSPAQLTQWLTAAAAKAPNELVTKYLAFAQQHTGLFARMVVLGELGLGGLLILGFLTPVAALLAFVMVAQFQFAGGDVFSVKYVTGTSGLVYLLQFLVLFGGRAGAMLGVDGFIGRAVAGGGGGGGQSGRK
jgi:uncharacterized membrane protein YphA (DoxX/SURF4 family)